MLAASAPLRVDFAGGYTDIDYVFNEIGGVTLNLAIGYRTTVAPFHAESPYEGSGNLAVYQPRQDSEIFAERLFYQIGCAVGTTYSGPVQVISEGPRGCGLGSSASLAVAAAKAYAPELSQSELVLLGQRAETLAENACGFQDEIASVYGGLNALWMPPLPSVGYVPYDAEPSCLSAIENNCSLWHKSAPRTSDKHVRSALVRFRENDPGTRKAFVRLNAIFEDLKSTLFAGDVDGIIECVHSVFYAQVQLREVVPDDVVDVAEVIAGTCRGAVKLQGAGGVGAAMLVVIPEDRRDNLDAVMAANGYDQLTMTMDVDGAKIVRREDGEERPND